MLLIGLICYSLTLWAPVDYMLCQLNAYRSEIASILSGYAFTIAGFIATIAAFLFTLGDRPYFQFYRRRGSFGDLMYLHGLTLLTQGVVFIFSILLLARPSLLRWSLVLTAMSMAQISLLTFVSYRLSKRSHDE